MFFTRRSRGKEAQGSWHTRRFRYVSASLPRLVQFSINPDSTKQASCLTQFHRHGYGFTAADAQRIHADTSATLLHCVEQRYQRAGPASADRVTEGNRAAVQI